MGGGVAAVFILAGLGIAPGAGADQGAGLQVFPLLEHFSAARIHHDGGARCAPGRLRIGKVADLVRKVPHPGIIDKHYDIATFIAGQHPGDAIAQPSTLAHNQRLRRSHCRSRADDVLIQTGDQVAEHGAHIPLRILGNDQVLAKDRNPAPCLVVAIVTLAIFDLPVDTHQQMGTSAGPYQRGVTTVGHLAADLPLTGQQRLVLLARLGEIALLKIGTRCSLCTCRRER